MLHSSIMLVTGTYSFSVPLTPDFYEYSVISFVIEYKLFRLFMAKEENNISLNFY